MEHRLLIFP